MEFTEEVLVLKVGKFREADLWVRLYSPSRGQLTAFAFGGCKSRRRFCGCLDALNIVECRVKSTKRGEYLCLEEGRLVSSPRGLRRNPERLGLAMNCLKFFEAATGGVVQGEEGYQVLLQTLDTLDADPSACGEKIAPFFPMLFRAKLLFSLGYGPDLTACSQCGKDARSMLSPLFLVHGGRLVCEACGHEGQGPALAVNAGVVSMLEFIRNSSPDKWARLRLESSVRYGCSKAVDAFIEYHLGLNWERGAFRKA